jgi:hypothetical protein
MFCLHVHSSFIERPAKWIKFSAARASSPARFPNASTLANDPLVALLFFCHRTSQAKPIDWHSNYSSGGGSSIRGFLIYDFEIPEDENRVTGFWRILRQLAAELETPTLLV